MYVSVFFFFFFFLTDHHPRARAHSDCVGTGFYECVLSLGISETFLHPVRIFYLHLASNTRSFTGPSFNQSIKRAQLQKYEKKSLQDNKTHLSARIHENNY